MRIGIDIDNVISNFDDELLKEYLEHDKTLRNTGIINENADYITRGMFDWTTEEESSFYRENIERIATNLKPIQGAKKYIDKLKQDGNEIYIITGRDNGEYTNPREMTEKWLEDNGIIYDKLIFTNAYDKQAKAEECNKNNIDIMIDDSTATCMNIQETGIKVLLMNTRFNQKSKELERVSSWEEIYNKITTMRTVEDTKKGKNLSKRFDSVHEMFKELDKFQNKVIIEQIKIVPNSNEDFIQLCRELDDVHNTIVAEQRAANSSCLYELEIYKNVYIMYYNQLAVGCIAFSDVIDGNIEIGRVYVREEYRNQGIATKIFEKVLKSSMEKGANSLILDTYERLESAVRLYKKWGFKIVPQFENLKDSPYSICMKKDLTR